MNLRCFISGIVLLCVAGTLSAQTTTFTYQGNLNSDGIPASGNHDFEFALFISGGSQIGSTLTRTNVPVTNGIFAVELDFGNNYTGANRELEIRVRPSGGGAFTTLLPRQLLRATPYSIIAVSALNSLNSTNATNATNASQLGGIAANQFVLTTDPRMTDARPPAPGSASYIQNQNGGPQASSNFNISGTGSANIFNATAQYSLNGNRILSIAGLNNFFAGVAAGVSNTDGVANAFFGTFAGGLNTSGGSNAFFGSSAGFSNTTGSENAFFGTSAGSSNTTGNLNTFAGAFAGFMNTTGAGNTFFGRQAGFNNSTASSNSFFGSSAGENNTTGAGNSFFGSAAGKNTTIGLSNSFFGSAAGSSNTTGGANSFFGLDAGKKNTVGNSNSFFGQRAGIENTTGIRNSFFGENAGQLNSTGSGNSYFGGQSGAINSTGDNNSFFGQTAGIGSLTGSNNTAVGAFTQLESEINNSTAIGARALVTTSNSIVLGSISGVNNATASTNVGIGTTAPTQRLDIAVNGGNIIFGGANCPTGSVSIGLNGAFGNCLNYSIRGNGLDVLINRPTGGEVLFRENNSTQVRIRPGGALAIAVLGTGGATALCRNASNEISTCSSSIRYKSNVSQFSSGLGLIRKLRPVSFNWLDGVPDLGLVAEEVAAVEPLLTTTNEKGQVEGVKYDRVGVVAINAIKEQQMQIEAQERRNEVQQKVIEGQSATIARQQAEIEALKKAVCSLAPTTSVCPGSN